MISRFIQLVSTLLLLATCSAWAASPATQNPHIQILSASCATCHGTNGNSVNTIPALAGMDKSYFIERMQAFRSGKPATVMGRHAKGLTPAELEQLAEYFSAQQSRAASLPPHPAKN